MSAGEPAHPSGANPGARMQADTPWSYTCGQCGNCCRDKDFIVTPFDVARIAEAIGATPSQVLTRYVDPSRPALRTTSEGWCVFFKTGEGCTIHAGRPAVCRLYPLGRTVTKSGGVEFEEADPHPETKGRYARAGVVADYLRDQGMGPYLEALSLLGAFLDDAFALASRAGVIAQLDAAVEAFWTGEGGPAPYNVMAVDLLADSGVFDDANTKLSAHLQQLRALCGLDTPVDQQAAMVETSEGRAQLGRLVVTAATIGVGLGVSPGFSAPAVARF